MANINPFDSAGRFTEPNPEALAALSDAERVAIARIRDASRALDAANLAAEANADALAGTQGEIAALEKVIPRVTRIDLVKAMAAETQRRRMGL